MKGNQSVTSQHEQGSTLLADNRRDGQRNTKQNEENPKEQNESLEGHWTQIN